MRIHIGKISPALADKIEELEKRLERYGPVTGKLSLHRKEYGDFYFAFVDMDIDQKQYGALRAALNGVMFRQSKLELKVAKPSYLEQLQQEAEQPEKPQKLNPLQIKRAKSTHPWQANVFPGRFWDVVRENPTFRVKIKDEIKKPRMKKRKLWGVEKRPLAKLVHHFVDGEWRDAEDRAVEIVEELHDEHARDLRIAEDLARSGAFLSDSDFEEFKENAKDIGNADYVDDDIEIVSKDYTPAAAKREDASEGEEQEEDGNDVPRNTTESLRSALTADALFTLFGAAPEEDVQMEEPAPQPAAVALDVSEPKVGLFFGHKSSPYLRTQSQAMKLVATFDPQAWEAEFFEHRGEWNRALRQRQRDAMKKARRMGKKRGE